MVRTLGVVYIGKTKPWSTASQPLAVRRLAGKPLLDWIVRRVTESQQIEQTVVVLDESSHHLRVSQVVPADVAVIRAGCDDGLACVNAAAQQCGAASLILVHIDSPFIDPTLLDRLIVDAHAHDCDYASYCLRSEKNILASRLGMVAEWCRSSAIDKADRAATSEDQRLRITPYIYSHPEEFKIRLIPVPTELDCNDIRLSIHSEEDWNHADLVLDALGTDDVDWQRIAGLLSQQPEIREQMQRLNQSTEID